MIELFLIKYGGWPKGFCTNLPGVQNTVCTSSCVSLSFDLTSRITKIQHYTQDPTENRNLTTNIATEPERQDYLANVFNPAKIPVPTRSAKTRILDKPLKTFAAVGPPEAELQSQTRAP